MSRCGLAIGQLYQNPVACVESSREVVSKGATSFDVLKKIGKVAFEKIQDLSKISAILVGGGLAMGAGFVSLWFLSALTMPFAASLALAGLITGTTIVATGVLVIGGGKILSRLLEPIRLG